jgi:hypothetical protein
MPKYIYKMTADTFQAGSDKPSSQRDKRRLRK